MSTAQEHRPQELRERILDATLRVIREWGMARTRTNAIAQAAGCSEGSIYRYFSGKPELLSEVMRTRLPGLVHLLPALPGRAGTATVQANLLEVTRAAVSFYEEAAPLLAGIVADANLFAERRELLARSDLGSHEATRALAGYLRAEQELGRVRPGADPDLAARLILSGCLGESFIRTLLEGAEDEMDAERYASALVEVVVRDLEPAGGAR